MTEDHGAHSPGGEHPDRQAPKELIGSKQDGGAPHSRWGRAKQWVRFVIGLRTSFGSAAVIGFFTAVGTVVTVGLMWQSSKHFTIEHRSELLIDILPSRLAFVPGHAVEVSVRITNGGKVPADASSMTYLNICDHISALDRDAGSKSEVVRIGPTQERSIVIPGLTVSESTAGRISARQLFVYIYGVVSSRDEFGERPAQEFCFRHDSISKRWNLCNFPRNNQGQVER